MSTKTSCGHSAVTVEIEFNLLSMLEFNRPLLIRHLEYRHQMSLKTFYSHINTLGESELNTAEGHTCH